MTLRIKSGAMGNELEGLALGEIPVAEVGTHGSAWSTHPGGGRRVHGVGLWACLDGSGRRHQGHYGVRGLLTAILCCREKLDLPRNAIFTASHPEL